MPIRKATSSLMSKEPENSFNIEKTQGESDHVDYPFSAKRINLNLKEKSKVQDNSHKKKFVLILSILFVVLFGVGTYFYLFNSRSTSILNPIFIENDGESESEGISNENVYMNPLNGVLIPNSQAAFFKDRKPIAVMVNNYEIARPSAGLNKADIVYEAVAEAGITRLMPLFYSNVPEKASSIRSARYYFAQLAAPYNPHYIHWGAAHVPPCQKLALSASGYCGPVGGKVETEPAVDAYDQIVKLQEELKKTTYQTMIQTFLK